MPGKLKYNYIGQKFGLLTVLKQSDIWSNDGRIRLWECRCDCGTIVLRYGRTLQDGYNSHCGCLKKTNLVGQKFGKLTVIKETKKNKGQRQSWWICKCECGEEIRKNTWDLRHEKYNRCRKCRKKEMCGDGNCHWKGCGKVPATFMRRIESILHRGSRILEINITLEYISDLFEKQNKRCALSGVDLHFEDKEHRDTTASLDRIDSKKGYIKGNVWWVHKDINIMKWALSVDKFLYRCKQICDFNKTYIKSIENRIV